MNPARSLGPAIIVGYWEHHWVSCLVLSCACKNNVKSLFISLHTLINPISFICKVYWIGPVFGAVLAGMAHEFFFAPSASRQKLVSCITCKDIEMLDTASMSHSSLSTITHTAVRAKQSGKLDHS